MILKADSDNDFYVITNIGEVPIREAFYISLSQQKRAPSRIAMEAGLSHAQLGEHVSIKTILLCYMEMDYEVIIRKKPL